MPLDEKSERGLAVIGDMMGPTFSDALRTAATSGKFGSAISQMALHHAFADAWGREGLERKQKSLVVIGVLIAQRQTAELKNHVKIGVANGLTVAELEGVLIQALPYVGFPAVASATTAVIEALREVGLDPNVKTSEERGLL
ncbi:MULTISPECIES: carboxymuconolactone decarboxylase family protein [Azospirillaceae]|uniref:Carboxymuconolactone decarboxylase n=1 Tax=Nitrospirillum viridazoti CBAmc TaxID=1441467 RepID=A0A248JUN3_9PROT|nr:MULTISPECIES: carboxymuconolactone decarboxylase family protein [Azospirillaceae]ASG22230.1 carboxymuconolactone decarboxylase [Nitrospirillum amazonense CBAmc]TWB31005.1 4-carboxymuconolactone decarboxylase [Nitrospirillum amazonense]